MKRDEFDFNGWMDDEFEVYDISDVPSSGPRNFDEEQPYNQQWDEPFDF